MNRPTLAGRLIRWQIAISGATCVLLVVGTVAAGRVWLRQNQDESLAKFSSALCGGIRNELEEPDHDFKMEAAAADFFREYSQEGHRQELRRLDGTLAVPGTFSVDPLVPFAGVTEAIGSCNSFPVSAQDGNWMRVCTQPCDGAHFLRVAAIDVIHLSAVRSIFWGLLIGLPLAILLGALASRWLVPVLLRPVGQLQQAATDMQTAPRLSMGVNAPYREIGELEQAFDGLLRRLDGAMLREKRFTQEASHELRTPLTAARLRLDEVRRTHVDDVGLVREIDSVLAHCSSLDRLLSSLLILARSDTEEVPLSLVNLGDLLREVVAQHRKLYPGTESRIDLVAPDEVLVRGNEELLERAVENLLENARRHAGSDARVRVILDVVGGKAAIAVQDDGPGIPEELRGRLFERFQRGRGPAKVGIGIGLAVVRAILIRHGGTAEASTSPAGGARFDLTLPLYGAAA